VEAGGALRLGEEIALQGVADQDAGGAEVGALVGDEGAAPLGIARAADRHGRALGVTNGDQRVAAVIEVDAVAVRVDEGDEDAARAADVEVAGAVVAEVVDGEAARLAREGVVREAAVEHPGAVGREVEDHALPVDGEELDAVTAEAELELLAEAVEPAAPELAVVVARAVVGS